MIWHAVALMATGNPPPPGLIRALIEGPGLVRGVEWHTTVGSTNVRALELCREGAEEIQLVLADTQTEGRGRHGRQWQAPPGTSLLASWMLSPRPPPPTHALLALLGGLVIAEVVERHLRLTPSAASDDAGDVALKWPNDVLVAGRKLAGILAERAAGCVVLGTGVNVDWTGLPRAPQIRVATSLAESSGRRVDRWRVLAGIAGILSRRYAIWQEDPRAFLAEYRSRCATIGQRVRVERGALQTLVGVATAVEPDGRLAILTDEGETVRVAAGDVEHLRHASAL